MSRRYLSISIYKSLFAAILRGRQNRNATNPRHARNRPALEELEPRWVPAGPPSQIAFLTGPQELLVGHASGTIQVELLDSSGNPAAAGSGGVTVTLSSTAPSGSFLDLSGSDLIFPTVTIPQGLTTGYFEYADTTAGTPSVTAASTGLTSAQQQETVTALTAALRVTNTKDSGAGSLRQAITAANAAGRGAIVFDTGVTGTINLLSALPSLNGNFTIVGPGANLLAIEPSASNSSAFVLLTVANQTSSVTLSGLTVANNDDTGIFNDQGQLTLEAVVVANNNANGQTASLAPFGPPGGILNLGNLSVLDSTIADNSTSGTLVAGGIDSEAGSVTVFDSTLYGNVDKNSNSAGGIGIYGGSLYIAHSTVTANVAQNTGQNTSGGGIDADGTSAIIFDTIVAGNMGSAGNPTDVSGTYTSLGHNLIGEANSLSSGFIGSDMVGTAGNAIDANLGTLGDNGGPTPTVPLLSGSLAIDVGDNTDAPGTDQRGDARIVNGTIDIGAFEYSPAASLAFVSPSQQLTVGIASAPITVQLQDVNGFPVLANSSASSLMSGNGGDLIMLSSTSGTGTFENVNGTAISSIVIAAGSSVASFLYEDTTVGTPTLTATDSTQAQFHGAPFIAQQQETVSTAQGKHLVFSVQPGNATAGTAITPAVQVQVIGSSGSLLTTDNSDKVTLSIASGPGKFAAGSTITVKVSGGIATFSHLILDTAGTYTLGEKATGGLTGGPSSSFAVQAAAANHLIITAPAHCLAGATFSATVEALDPFGNLDLNDSGPVSLAESTGPAGGTLSGTLSGQFSAGQASFTGLSLSPAGKYKLSATSAQGVHPATANITATTVTHFGVSILLLPTGGLTAGDAAEVVVTALDQFNDIVVNYTGTVHITSSDPQVGMLANYQFTTGNGSGGDNGVHSFQIILKTAGKQTVTVTDTVQKKITGTSPPITVVAGTINHLLIAGYPTIDVSGTGHGVTVQAVDQFNNVVKNYIGTVTLSSSDSAARGLPASFTYTAAAAGSHTFQGVILNTVGEQTLSAQDQANSLSSNPYPVDVENPPPVAAALIVIGPGVPVVSGVPFLITVEALSGQVIDSQFIDKVGFSTSDPLVQSGLLPGLPAPSAFAPTNQGVKQFVVTLYSLGEQTITVTDLSNGTVIHATLAVDVEPPVGYF